MTGRHSLEISGKMNSIDCADESSAPNDNPDLSVTLRKQESICNSTSNEDNDNLKRLHDGSIKFLSSQKMIDSSEEDITEKTPLKTSTVESVDTGSIAKDSEDRPCENSKRKSMRHVVPRAIDIGDVNTVSNRFNN